MSKKKKVGILLNSLQSMHAFSQYPRTALEGKSTDPLFIEGDMGRTILEGKKKELFCNRLLVAGNIYVYGNETCYLFGIHKKTVLWPKNPLFSPHTKCHGLHLDSPLGCSCHPGTGSRAQKIQNI